MVKIMEDVQVKYDQSVRNSVGNIIQFAYGGDNLDPCETISTKEGQGFCNIQRLVEQLNLNHEHQ
jgi:DNA-directed RNA polymerase beta' subunit